MSFQKSLNDFLEQSTPGDSCSYCFRKNGYGCEPDDWFFATGEDAVERYAKKQASACGRCELVWKAISSEYSPETLKKLSKLKISPIRDRDDIEHREKMREIELWIQESPQTTSMASIYLVPSSLEILTVPGTKAWYNKIMEWISRCDKDHAECQPQRKNFLPKRLLKLDFAGDNRDTMLYESSPAEKGKYAALTWCWGNVVPLKTTREKLEEHKKRITWESLPLVFQEALNICRELDISFIWIDALCIIQGDLEDWDAESSKMAGYYGGAWLTISASGSKDSTQSCMPNRKFRQLDDVQGCEPVTLESSSYDHLHVDFEERYQLDSIPIFMRAWTLQERLLSRRVLHMTPREAKWDCCEGIECECTTGPGYYERQYSTKSHHRRAATSGWPCYPILGFEYWHNFLNRYHWRQITYSSDKLKAVEGIARELQASQMEHGLIGQYILGIWDGRLFLRSLLWQPAEGKTRPRAKNSLFPSWTWASMEGSWSYEFLMTYPHRAEEKLGPFASEGPQWTGAASATVVDKPSQAWDIDHSQKKDYPLILRGKLLLAREDQVAKRKLKRCFDLDPVDKSSERILDKTLWYLKIWSEGLAEMWDAGLAEGLLEESEATSCLGLILEAVSGSPETFVRIGMFRGEPTEFAQAKWTIVTIL